MTVHKMISQKEVVAAALQFYRCIKVYDGLVGWLAVLFLLDFLAFLTAVCKQIRCMECPFNPLCNNSLWFTNDVVTVKVGDAWLRWSSMRQSFGCSEILVPVLRDFITLR